MLWICPGRAAQFSRHYDSHEDPGSFARAKEASLPQYQQWVQTFEPAGKQKNFVRAYAGLLSGPRVAIPSDQASAY